MFSYQQLTWQSCKFCILHTCIISPAALLAVLYAPGPKSPTEAVQSPELDRPSVVGATSYGCQTVGVLFFLLEGGRQLLGAAVNKK